MTDQATGRLTPTEIEHVQNWISKHVGGPLVCPICRNSKWVVSQEFVAPITLIPVPNLPQPLPLGHPTARFNFSGRVYPQVQVLCLVCGLTYYFNTVIMGFSEGDWKPHQGAPVSGAGGGNG